MQNKKEKISIGDKINDFVQKNRKGIFIVSGIIFIVFIGLIVFIVVSEQTNKKAIAEVEELSDEFNNLRFNINDNNYAAEVNTLLNKLNAFTGNKQGFAGGKAWSMIAQIHSGREEWAKAEDAWLNSARTGAKTYLGPIAFFNAAVAAEEQGKTQKAIEYFKECVSHKFEFPDAPRAQFNIGRLYEQLGNTSEALEAYRAVIINWQWDRLNMNLPNMTLWQDLARNQIIRLEVK